MIRNGNLPKDIDNGHVKRKGTHPSTSFDTYRLLTNYRQSRPHTRNVWGGRVSFANITKNVVIKKDKTNVKCYARGKMRHYHNDFHSKEIIYGKERTTPDTIAALTTSTDDEVGGDFTFALLGE